MTSRVWHLWPGRHWPALPEEEQQFVDDLQRLATDSSGTQRMHYTAVLNALRCGLTAADMLELVPGMRAADLLAAYVDLERLRVEAYHAWRDIIEDPTVSTLSRCSESAGKLLPVPLARLSTVASHVRNPDILAAAAHALQQQIEVHARAAAQVEHALADRTPPNPSAVELGTKLHNPKEPALWGAPYFLPGRVTALSPVRVADLLGERPMRVIRTR